MLRAVSQLAADLASETDPLSVIDALQHTIAAEAGVGVLGTWRLPTRKEDWNAYHLNRNVFWHPDTPTDDWYEYLAHAREHGPSVMTTKAWRSAGPFTFTEALREIRPVGIDRWIFEYHRQRGRRDGFYCPRGRWSLMFTSPTVLQLTPVYRGLLFAAATMATSRMEQIIDHRGLDRRQRPSLSPREAAVLQHLSHGDSLVETAGELAIHLGSAKTLLLRAQKKLGTRHHYHAIAEALRHNIIS